MPPQKTKKNPLLQELKKGIRVYYLDKDEKYRTERIHSIKGSRITVINSLEQKHRINISQIKGYWKPRVKASPKNMITVI